jgi:hypothetical protein
MIGENPVRIHVVLPGNPFSHLSLGSLAVRKD